jgi:hypothetical protein
VESPDQHPVSAGEDLQVMAASLFSVTNAQIVVLSVVCSLLFVLVNNLAASPFGRLGRLAQTSTVALPLLLGVQLVLVFLLPAYRIVVLIYLFLYAVGINLHILTTPSYLKTRFSHFVLVPILGLIAVSLLGSYFVAFDVRIAFLPPVLLSVSLIALVMQFAFNKANMASMLDTVREGCRPAFIAYTCILTPVILCLISPVLFSNYLTSPVRRFGSGLIWPRTPR